MILLQDGFPSPLGDYVFNPVIYYKHTKHMLVSVPSRGLCFQSIAKRCHKWYMGEFPSPLGDYVFNQAIGNDFIARRLVSVPSRGLCFQSNCFTVIKHLSALEFPSPLGDYVFNPNMMMKRKGNNTMTVSVPSRGLCFQSLQF